MTNIEKIFNDATQGLLNATTTVKNLTASLKATVDNQVQRLEDWKDNFINNTYRMDFRASKQGKILKVITTPQAGANAIRFDIAKFQSQEDWGHSQIFIRIRRNSYSPTSESIYRIDNYYNTCTVNLVVDGGCNILNVEDNGEVADLGNGRTINQYILYANLSAYLGYNIELDIVNQLSIVDYRNKMLVTQRGVELLSNIRISE